LDKDDNFRFILTLIGVEKMKNINFSKIAIM